VLRFEEPIAAYCVAIEIKFERETTSIFARNKGVTTNATSLLDRRVGVAILGYAYIWVVQGQPGAIHGLTSVNCVKCEGIIVGTCLSCY
jgi:hypothetical protein